MIAMTSGRSEITAHFAAPPFADRELKTPGLHAVTTVKDVFGGDLTIGMAYTTGKFHKENPKLYGAFLAALTEAVDMIKKDKRKAAETYVAMAKDKTPVDELVAMMSQPGFDFGTTPQNVTKMGQFMNRIGSIAVSPKDWKELFFPDIHNLPGS
jgi:NitT/TauT family transport system substrate-binding protein